MPSEIWIKINPTSSNVSQLQGQFFLSVMWDALNIFLAEGKITAYENTLTHIFHKYMKFLWE